MTDERSRLLDANPAPALTTANRVDDLSTRDPELEYRIKMKTDLRLCTIAGLLCSLNLLDSGIISSASVTSMLKDLELDRGKRYSIAILIFTVTGVCLHLPATVAVRTLGPRVFFTVATFGFGLVTMCTAFIHNWRQMILMRVLLGIFMSGIYPGLALLLSSWYRREELQLRFGFVQSGQLLVLATGGIVNFGLNHLDGHGSLKGWQYMYLVQGLITCIIGIITYWWIVDFPENAQKSFYFLDQRETDAAVARIQSDRKDVLPSDLNIKEIFTQFCDPKLVGFSVAFFLQNMVSTALSYFLPIILRDGMGFSENKSILLSTPPYYYAIIPAIISSRIGDKFLLRGPVIIINCLCLIMGFSLLGFSNQVTVRYIGTFLATGGYVSNWAALNGYQASNIAGQWKRAVTAASVTAFNGLGGVAGSFILRQNEAPRYLTSIWVSIGSQIAIILLVGAFSLYFFVSNHQQSKGKVLLEGEGFRYSY